MKKKTKKMAVQPEPSDDTRAFAGIATAVESVMEKHLARLREHLVHINEFQKRHFALLAQYEDMLTKKFAESLPAKPVMPFANVAHRAPNPTGLAWFDILMNGGIVPRAIYVITGGPASGKSTLATQLLGHGKSLYVSGEEQGDDIVMRAKRLGQPSGNFVILATRQTRKVVALILGMKPTLVIVDSIQTIGDRDIKGKIGGRKQVADLLRRTVEAAQSVGAAIVFLRNVTKKGDPAGPRLVDEFADCCIEIRFPSDADHDTRSIHCCKNRFGENDRTVMAKLTDRRGLVV